MSDAAKERPVLFSGPMVRAILDGSKTQTRRVVKGPNADIVNAYDLRGMQGFPDGSSRAVFDHHTEEPFSVVCPYGKPGDRLWVRETWAAPHSFDTTRPGEIPGIEGDGPRMLHYAATANLGGRIGLGGLLGRPAIFMPRWASRITLEVTSVRVERVRSISEADAKAEGAPVENGHHIRGAWFGCGPSHREGFAQLWQDINGTESWAASPWVWVIGFRRVP